MTRHKLEMATDYEEYYRDNPNGLGQPTASFVDFFKTYEQTKANVLDIGCGQGRDAIFIARLGHIVTAFDLSPTGIRDLKAVAGQEKLNIEAIVADIRECVWNTTFDVIVIDRTLHMLSPQEQIDVLNKLILATHPGSHVLIADERSNLPSFKAVLSNSKWRWQPILEMRGFLFVQRE